MIIGVHEAGRRRKGKMGDYKLVPNLQQIVTDALVSMVSGVTQMVPPTDEPLPDYIQAPIDRAVTRIRSEIDLHAAAAPAMQGETDVSGLVEALEEIAQSCDSGRHDGLPEDGPALSDVEAWLVANDALAAYRKQGGEA